MTRRQRHDEPDAVFHITTRVNWQDWHLQPDHRADKLMRALSDCLEEFGVDALGYGLMSNHCHMVLRSPGAPLFRQLTTRRTKCRHYRPWPRGHVKAGVISQCMHKFLSRTAREMHRELDVKGHFWERRYDARPIDSARYLAVAIAYDHLNPVKERMVRRAEDYRRSSAGWWHDGRPPPITVAQRPLPFGLDHRTLREQILAREADPAFRSAVDAVRTHAPPGEERRSPFVQLLEILEEQDHARTPMPQRDPINSMGGRT